MYVSVINMSNKNETLKRPLRPPLLGPTHRPRSCHPVRPTHLVQPPAIVEGAILKNRGAGVPKASQKRA